MDFKVQIIVENIFNDMSNYTSLSSFNKAILNSHFQKFFWCSHFIHLLLIIIFEFYEDSDI